MFGHERRQINGIVRNIRTDIVRKRSGNVRPNGGEIKAQSIEILTFSLATLPGTKCSDETAVELIGKEPRFGTLPVEEGDEVEIQGIWKPRVATLTAITLTNRTQGTVIPGRRFVV